MTGDEDEPCHCCDPGIPLFRMTQLCEWSLQFMLTHVLNHLSDMLRSSKSAVGMEMTPPFWLLTIFPFSKEEFSHGVSVISMFIAECPTKM